MTTSNDTSPASPDAAAIAGNAAAEHAGCGPTEHGVGPGGCGIQDDTRKYALVAWLTGLAPRVLVDVTTLRLVAADASFRRYWRVDCDDGFPRPFAAPSLIVLDAPPPVEALQPFLALADLLNRLGLRAPRAVACNPERGFALLEDFGDRSFSRALSAGGDETALYDLATDTLVALFDAWQTHGAEALATLAAAHRPPAYDRARLLAEAWLFVDWHLPQRLGRAGTAAERRAFGHACHALIDALEAHPLPQTLVLRDFHVDNLIDLTGTTPPGAPAVRRCGLLDFQDAVIGSPAYDVISLADDARRDVPAALAARVGARYSAATRLDGETLQGHALLLGLQRAIKIAGIFTRLAERDGKPGYLGHQTRVWQRIRAGLWPDHPAARARMFAEPPSWALDAVAPLRAWFTAVFEHLSDGANGPADAPLDLAAHGLSRPRAGRTRTQHA